uniref:Kunitz/Bovine pancreatic trypsin inhibitor domain protein n=1 Tax=Rhabditophanes sp. KR3021 TaxID=114890 RepID=A0AC35UHE2_9BILA
MAPYCGVFAILLFIVPAYTLECNPDSTKKVDSEDPNSYLYCNLEGLFTKKSCPEGKQFNTIKAECESILQNDDPFLLPQYQAPDDICSGGTPLTRLGAPVICSPSISSCPDSYSCSIYGSTGIAYCCKNTNYELEESRDIVCPGTQVTLFDKNALPKTCVLNQKNSCPRGFTCSLIGLKSSRCCGSSFGCSPNSAESGFETGLINHNKTSPALRYYYDRISGSCRIFKHTLIGGNFNSFRTLEQCEGFCLESQCINGGIPLRRSVANTYCSTLINQNINTCGESYSCSHSNLNGNSICCPTKEVVCSGIDEHMVSAGNPCFHKSLSILRYYFSPEQKTCLPFQYFGCNGNHHFVSKTECLRTCVASFEHVCNGMAPLFAPNHDIQECSEESECPDGYRCKNRTCCPELQYACQSLVSLGNSCDKQKAQKMYYFDEEKADCLSFLFNGCGGNANRFYTKSACLNACTKPVGECLNGMSPFRNDGMVQECTLNVAGSCPPSYSCVTSTLDVPICCQSNAKCPNQRKPYLIPNSDSFVSCSPEVASCPNNYECVLANKSGKSTGKLGGFHLCCSVIAGVGRGRPGEATGSNNKKIVSARSQCPAGAKSNGVVCRINVQNSCANGYTCIGLGLRGYCCDVKPACKKGLKEVFVGLNQVQLCGKGITGCPNGSACSFSTIANVHICCKTTSFFGNKALATHKCKGNKLPFYELGSREPKNCETNRNCPATYFCHKEDEEGLCCPIVNQCDAGGMAYIINGLPLGCNILANNCPKGYSCTGSDPKHSICCKQPLDLKSCGVGFKAYAMAGRPLVCAKGSSCPDEYSCTPSITDPTINICCTSEKVRENMPSCIQGEKYIDSFTKTHKECSRDFNTCAVGYDCDESSIPGKWICCSTNLFNKHYEGYCPKGQIPYVGLNVSPPSCHQTLTPCPSSGAFQCIYSQQQMDSFCCAPIETAIYMAPQRKTTPQVTSNVMTGCPINTLPLMDEATKLPKRCSVLDMCDTGFDCKQSSLDASIYQCCSPYDPVTEQTEHDTNKGYQQQVYHNNNNNGGFQNIFGGQFVSDNQANGNFMMPNRPDMQLVLRAGVSSGDVEELDASKGCAVGYSAIENKCHKSYFLGQRGCVYDEQCSLNTPFAFCNKGYCSCSPEKLIHNAKCVDVCPVGFFNIAGRCHDITTVMLMDSVETRSNGTLYGFCLETVVVEEQCYVKNSYCNEKSITCQCKPGFELDLNFENMADNGTCLEFSNTKYTSQQLNDFLKPQNEESLFYVMEMRNEGEEGSLSVETTTK